MLIDCLLLWLIRCPPPPSNHPKPLKISVLYDFPFLVENISQPGVEKNIYQFGIYEIGTLHIVRACLRRGDCFLDVGSNVGLMTVTAAFSVGATGKVYAFEPEPRVRNLIYKNIELNQLKNVTVLDFALGTVNETKKLYLQDEISLGSATLLKPADEREGFEVKVRKLADFISAQDLPSIRMIKIDAEGWEFQVLQGARQLLGSPEAPILCVEYSKFSHEDSEIQDIYQFVSTVNNYQVYKLEKTKDWISKLIRVHSEADLPEHDNLFCFLPKHLASLPERIFKKK